MSTAFALALALSAPAAAPENVNLMWKLKEGDAFYSKAKANIDQTFKVMGRDVQQTITTETVVRFTVKSAKPGATVVEMTYLSNKTTAQGIAGANAADDKLKNVTLTFTLGTKLEVVKMEGYDKVIDALAGENEQAKAAAKGLMPEALVKQSLNDTFALVPGGAAKVGSTWKRKDFLPLAGLGNVATDSTYKLDEVQGDVATVNWTATGTYKAGNGELPGLPVKISKADLKVEKLSGSYTFDLTNGRIKGSKTALKLGGTMTLVGNGKEVEMEIVQKLTQSSSISEKNPLKE